MRRKFIAFFALLHVEILQKRYSPKVENKIWKQHGQKTSIKKFILSDFLNYLYILNIWQRKNTHIVQRSANLNRNLDEIGTLHLNNWLLLTVNVENIYS